HVVLVPFPVTGASGVRLLSVSLQTAPAAEQVSRLTGAGVAMVRAGQPMLAAGLPIAAAGQPITGTSQPITIRRAHPGGDLLTRKIVPFFLLPALEPVDGSLFLSGDRGPESGSDLSGGGASAASESQTVSAGAGTYSAGGRRWLR